MNRKILVRGTRFRVPLAEIMLNTNHINSTAKNLVMRGALGARHLE